MAAQLKQRLRIKRLIQSTLVSTLAALAVLLLGLRASASEIGSGDTMVTVGTSQSMAHAATFSVTQGTPAVAPDPVVTGQPATLRFHVALSWPADANVSVQQQYYEITDTSDGTISAINAPPDCAVAIAADQQSATLSRTGGDSATDFDLTVTVAYASAGSKVIIASGTVGFEDGSSLVSVPSTSVPVVASGQSPTARTVVPTGTLPDLDPDTQRRIATLLAGGRVLYAAKGAVVIEVGGAAVVGTLAAGVYAVVDGVVYYKTGQSVGPFTTLGRWVGDRLPAQSEMEAAPVLRQIPFDAATANQIALERARRKKTDVCLELKGMELLYQAKHMLAVAVAIKAAEAADNCDTDDPSGWVVRAGIATPERLQQGTSEHRAVPGLFGFSVQHERGRSIPELAAAGHFPNKQISVTTAGALITAGLAAGFSVGVVKSPGTGYHCTVQVPHPLPDKLAQALSRAFKQMPNSAPVGK